MIAIPTRGVLHSVRRVQAVGRLVQQHFEHGFGWQVQRLACEQHLAAHVAIGDPASIPPVAQLHEPATLDTGAEHDHHVR